MQYNGVVSNVSSFPYENKKLYSFQLRGDKGIYYRTGEDAPKFEVGDFVNFEGKPGKQSNSVQVDFKSIQTKKAEAVKEATGVSIAATQGGSGSVSRDNGYWESKDARIERQACRNTALELIRILSDNGALVGITEKSKPKDKVEIIEALLEHYMEHFIEDNNGKKKEANSVVENLDDTVPY